MYKYPLPCFEECGLQKACVSPKSCRNWLAVDFCNYYSKWSNAIGKAEKRLARKRMLDDMLNTLQLIELEG